MLTKAVSMVTLVLLALTAKAVPADTLVVIFDRQNFVQGDSIGIEIYTEPYRSKPIAKTLHLWIDNVKTGQRWKYRYPFLKGRYKIALKINDSMPNGTYAFNFLLQDQFLAINGKVLHATAEDRSVNFVAKAKNKAPIIDGADLQPGGYFKIDGLFYTDSVLFSFSPVQHQKENKLRVSIATAIDSAFIPETTAAEWITVGIDETKRAIEEPERQGYIFSMTDKKDDQLLEEIVLKSRVKSRVKKFEEENVSGLFASDNTITLDFYDSDELSSYTDIYSYLVTKMPGLRTETDPENGQPVLYWRNERTDIYVDEFADTDFSPYALTVKDIELVKIYRPGTRMGLDGLGGAVAIYTKRFSNRPGNKLSNYSFYVKGYTPKNSEWK